MKKLVFISIIVCSIANAQSDSSIISFSYYPLHYGDVWEYYSIYNDYPIIDSISVSSLTDIGDTVLQNGMEYNILLYRCLHSVHDSSLIFERIDTLNGLVFSYVPTSYDSTLLNHEREIDNLSAEPGDTSKSKRGSLFAPSYYFYSPYNFTLCQSDTVDTLFGKNTDLKIFEAIGSLAGERHSLAKGLGLYYERQSWDFGTIDTYLIYAKISGEEYGQKIDAISNPVSMPISTVLFQNYPNPFNPTTTIRYRLAKKSFVVIKIYNILGKCLNTIVNKYQTSGDHSITFNASNLSSGVYFYTFKANNYIAAKKLLLLK